MDLKIPAAVSSENNKASKSANIKGNRKKPEREPTHKGPTANPKEFSYDKKHYPTARTDCHTWNECVKIKPTKNKNKEKMTIDRTKIGKEETPDPVSTLSTI